VILPPNIKKSRGRRGRPSVCCLPFA
jgi:hypothetical protein